MMETQQARQIDLRILGEALVNPKAALMHLTIEIDRELRKLLVSAGVLQRYLNLASSTLPNAVEILRKMGSVVPKNLEEAIDEFWSLRNSAVHNADFNQTLAYHALAMLGRLFRHGSITHHGGFVNLASGRMAPLTLGSLRATKRKAS
jgi:hypothetical protein